MSYIFSIYVLHLRIYIDDFSAVYVCVWSVYFNLIYNMRISLCEISCFNPFWLQDKDKHAFLLLTSRETKHRQGYFLFKNLKDTPKVNAKSMSVPSDIFQVLTCQLSSSSFVHTYRNSVQSFLHKPT